MSEEFELALGERKFKISSPFTFKQLRVIEPEVEAIKVMFGNDKPATPEFYDKLANIFLAVINRTDATFTRIILDDIPISSTQLRDAYQVVLKAAGMWKEKAKDEAPGEDPAKTAQKP